MFQIPGPPVHKRLFKAVPGAHHGACRERLRTRCGGIVLSRACGQAAERINREPSPEPLFIDIV
jgi:hypothetical protein